MVRILTQEEYKAVLNDGADFCACCGGKFEIAGLIENFQMPDLSQPSTDGSYPLQGGFSVCYLCASHAENGPCQPEKVVTVLDAASLPPAESRQCTQCGDFIPEKMGFQYNGKSLCASCLPWPDSEAQHAEQLAE